MLHLCLGRDPAFLHGASMCRHHLEGWVPGSMGARLASLAKARLLFALGAETPHFCMAGPGADTAWRIGCQGQWKRVWQTL